MNLEAIDKAVAEKVMGWHEGCDPLHADTYIHWANADGKINRSVDDWCPTKEREDSDELWGYLIDNGWSLSIKWLAALQKWTVSVFDYKKPVWGEAESKTSENIALCLAALEAHGVDTQIFMDDEKGIDT